MMVMLLIILKLRWMKYLIISVLTPGSGMYVNSVSFGLRGSAGWARTYQRTSSLPLFQSRYNDSYWPDAFVPLSPCWNSWPSSLTHRQPCKPRRWGIPMWGRPPSQAPTKPFPKVPFQDSHPLIRFWKRWISVFKVLGLTLEMPRKSKISWKLNKGSNEFHVF